MRKIDVHNHFYPEAYIDAIRYRSRATEIVERDGETLIEYAGDYSVIVPAHRDPDVRIADLDRAGVDMQVLSLTVPGVHLEEPEFGVELARATNDAFAEICETHPDRFRAFATLPLQAPEAAARELEHAVNDLGLVGAMIFSNLGEMTLDDPKLWPVYEAAESLGAPLLIHPVAPHPVGHYADHRLVPVLGFPFDVTLAAARLVLSGTFDRFPNLTLILSQLGGALPMIAERVGRGQEIYPEISGTLQRPAVDYFREMYVDTVPYGEIGIPLAIDFHSVERVLLASDHPHQIGSLDDCATVIESMDIPEDDRRLMLAGNAEKLFGLSA
ncbi:MAG: amidohydrolase family protein [Chloroflexota bacterium]